MQYGNTEYLKYQYMWVEFIQKYIRKAFKKPKPRIMRFRAKGARKIFYR